LLKALYIAVGFFLNIESPERPREHAHAQYIYRFLLCYVSIILEKLLALKHFKNTFKKSILFQKNSIIFNIKNQFPIEHSSIYKSMVQEIMYTITVFQHFVFIACEITEVTWVTLLMGYLSIQIIARLLYSVSSKMGPLENAKKIAAYKAVNEYVQVNWFVQKII